MRRTAKLLALSGSLLTLAACANPNEYDNCTYENTPCGPMDGAASVDGSSGDSSTGGPDGGQPDATLLDGGHDGATDGSSHHDSGEDANVDSGVTCDAGLSYCSGQGCVPTDTVTNCGGCGESCTAPTGGSTSCALDAAIYACAPTCSGGETDCSGECVTLTTTAHCGACGTSCTSAPDGGEPACIEDGGTYACTFTCDTNEHACNGACYPNTDPPSTTGDSCIVSPTYGVFVNASPPGSNTTGNGTPTAPYASIGYALSHLSGKTRVYVCGGSYPENITLAANVNLYGGLDCSTWAYNATDVATVNPSSGIPITVNGATTEIDDFTFQSASATTAGASSIAAFANGATLTGKRCSFTAGAGMGAVSGTFTANYTGTAPSGGAPDGGTGGAGGAASCIVGDSVGGAGGNGATGANGDAGTASGPTIGEDAGYTGAGGTGGSGCTSGHFGADGTAGTPAASGATRAGTLTSSGWAPQGGQNGVTGNPGQGGGGGGGATIPTSIGGGGGGAGGCGGAGGPGGAGGGSSFALLSYDSTVELYSCVLSAGSGGAGAAGAPGQMGQAGASGGTSLECNGNYGGNGAGGGGGGGGAGGISATSGYVGTAPIYDSVTSSHLSAVGGGAGGGTALGGDGGSNGLPTAPSGLASSPAGLTGATSPTPLPLN